MTGFLWFKALHIVAVITWFAGLFYLPRLFIYHRDATDTASRARFEIMETKLYRIIMRPSMIAAVGFGLIMLWQNWAAWSNSLWLWLKLVLVILLLGYHHYCARLIKQFQSTSSPHSDRFLRIFNEIPAVLLILIVILVVVKPF